MSHPGLENRSTDSKHIAIVVVWLVLGIVGCRPAPPPPATLPPILQTQAPTTAAKAYAPPVNDGVIAGRVLYTGPVVQRRVLDTKGRTVFPVRLGTESVVVNVNGALQNVVVYVKSGLPKQSYRPPVKPLVLDTNCYRFEPHVVGVQVGQPVLFRNADPDHHQHRVKGKSIGTLAFALPTQGATSTITPTTAEFGIEVGSDRFPWMPSYLCAIPHPFFNVTNNSGFFRLENLPPGTYAVETWHETLGVRQQTVTVQKEQTTRVTFTYQ